MSGWKSRVDDLLYDGETVRETVDVGTARVVVTSHRVLAFTPDADGENFRQADRPNVEGVEAGTDANERWLRYAVRFGVAGGLLAVTGVFVDFGSIFGDITFDTESAGQVGAGGLISAAQTLIDVMAKLDFVMLAFGALSLFVTAVLVGVYLFERDPTIVIAVAGGGEDILLPRSDTTTEIRHRLEAAIFPDRSPGGVDGSRAGTGDFGDSDGFDSAEDAGFGETGSGAEDGDDGTGTGSGWN